METGGIKNANPYIIIYSTNDNNNSIARKLRFSFYAWTVLHPHKEIKVRQLLQMLHALRIRFHDLFIIE
jgi:hypothetical protein